MAGVAAVASLVFSIGASDRANREAKAARKDQRAASQKQESMQKARDAQSRRQKIREERVRRSQVMQRAQNLGSGGSSGMVGSLSSLGTQTGSALGFQKGQSMGAQSVGQSLQASADHQVSSQTWSSYSAVGMQAFSSLGGFGTIFGDKTAPPPAQATPPANDPPFYLAKPRS